MGNILSFLKAAPYREVTASPEQIDQEYHYWRWRIFWGMFIGYALFYFTRKSFTFVTPALIADLGFQKSDLGFLSTILSLTYGLSKFVSGLQSDRSNPRYFMSIGLILTGVFNICFGLSSSLYLFALFWGLNGWFQGWGWPPCARLLTHWYSHKERGSWWASWNVSHNVGGALIPLVVGVAADYYGWRFAMFVPGVICILGGLWLMYQLRDTPQSLGLPPIEKFRNDYSGIAEGKNYVERELTTREILFEYVLNNKFIWLLAFSYFFLYIVRTGVNDWSVLYLVEEKKYSQIGATGAVSLFEVGGFFGSLLAGFASDRIFKARRGPVNIAYSFLMLFAVAAFWYTPAGFPWLDSASMFMIGFLVFGPQMLIGVAAAELSHKKASATATGFAGWFAYFGAAFAGYPLGLLTQHYGWEGFFWALIICCAITTLLLLPTWRVQAYDAHEHLEVD